MDGKEGLKLLRGVSRTGLSFGDSEAVLVSGGFLPAGRTVFGPHFSGPRTSMMMGSFSFFRGCSSLMPMIISRCIISEMARQ